MKTPRRAAFRWLALPLALAVSLALAQAPVVERPTLTKGDRWVLGEGAFELVRVERDAYVFALPADGREIHLSRDLAPGAFLRRGVADWQLRPAPSLPWPLRVGKWGVGVGQLRLRSEFDPIPVRVTWQVEAYEQIKVPAGALGAFRIAYRLDLEGVGTGSGGLRGGRNFWSVTTWYAPAVQRLARAQFIGATGLDFELAALEPPATSPAPSPPPTVAKPTAPAPAAPSSPPVAAPPAVPPSATPAPPLVVAKPAAPAPAAPSSPPVAAPPAVPPSATPAPPLVVAKPAAPEPSAAAKPAAPPSSPLAPAAPDPGLPRAERWAVVVGIGRYENPAIPPLRFAAADAEAFYEVLVTRAGFPKDQVLLFTERTERKPTLRNLKQALGTFLARRPQKNDLVVVFFAGHGAPEVDPRGIEADGLAKYLVPIDADPNDLYSTALPMDEFQTIFDRLESERAVVFLDTCYSGAAGGRTFAAARTRASRVDDFFLERLTRSRGRAIVAASRANEVSIELPELGHGVFTYYLVRGLAGAADLDRDGIVVLQELYQYLEYQVAREARGAGGNQHPVLKGELAGPLPLVRVAPP
jgi:Caspase domain